jgi:hypothetical protein
VYVKKGRKAQEYMIRCDNGESMRGTEEHLEAAEDEGESEAEIEEAKDNMDRDSDEVSTDPKVDPQVRTLRQDHDRDVTDDEAGEVVEGEEAEMGEEIAVEETVTKGDEGNSKRKTWTRIAALPTDLRTEELQDTTLKKITNS